MVENTLAPPAENVNVSDRLMNFWVDLALGGEGSFSVEFWRKWGGSLNVRQMLRALQEIADGFYEEANLLGTHSKGAQKIDKAGVPTSHDRVPTSHDKVHTSHDSKKLAGARACFAAGAFLAAEMGGDEKAAEEWRRRFSEDYAQARDEAHGRVMGKEFITAGQVAEMVRAVEEFAKERGSLPHSYEPLI
uniref:Uncharacterized protein n=1 Tax=candidate division CPR3 bacterium TaxID=2268181 RepID=A0A7C5YYR7_UNCC3